MADDRIDSLEQQVSRLADRLEDFENEREAIALLPERVEDLREAVRDTRQLMRDFRDDCRGRLDALTQKHPTGNGYVAKAGKLDVTTWISIAALVVVPIVVAILTR